jgi:hypothetical protein
VFSNQRQIFITVHSAVLQKRLIWFLSLAGMIRRKKTNSKKEYKQLNLIAWITCMKMKCVVFWLLNPELLWWVSVCYLRVPLTARIIWCLWGMSEWVWNMVALCILTSTIEVLRNKSVPVPLCPPHIPHRPAWNWTVASMVRVPQPTAWAITQPLVNMAKVSLKHKGTAHENWGVQ